MVQRQNLEFLHTRSHFSYPYFQFMKQLLLTNYNYTKSQLDQSNSSEAMVGLHNWSLSVCLSKQSNEGQTAVTARFSLWLHDVSAFRHSSEFKVLHFEEGLKAEAYNPSQSLDVTAVWPLLLCLAYY